MLSEKQNITNGLTDRGQVKDYFSEHGTLSLWANVTSQGTDCNTGDAFNKCYVDINFHLSVGLLNWTGLQNRKRM